MITQSTTLVHVRVDLASHRVIGVSDEVLLARPGQPVFSVASNQANLNYYIVESNPNATFGIDVRPATSAEIAAIDDASAAATSAAIAAANMRMALNVKAFYDNMFVARFVTAAFMDVDDILSACVYSGTDTNMLTVVQPLAKSVQNAFDEWRYNVVQPIITGIIASPATSTITLDSTYTITVQNTLDTFLTDRGFDIATYHR